jgi:hypothetical protein
MYVCVQWLGSERNDSVSVLGVTAMGASLNRGGREAALMQGLHIIDFAKMFAGRDPRCVEKYYDLV